MTDGAPSEEKPSSSLTRKEIEDYYLNQQLVDAIYARGEIPEQSETTIIGVGFIDIADYTFLSKFLSPVENQVMLNGLYTAFNLVLNRHGGYLNKIEGDSLMFHFGGITDRRVLNMSDEEATEYIARELFYTCIEMQRVCNLFNQANKKFIDENADETTHKAVTLAFNIIDTLRNTFELRSSINALFQIRIRIGANIGEVTIGNFGPDGAKSLDIIGMPVIEAKRMESTAPIGGLRISASLYDTLERKGIVNNYYHRFVREAQALFGQFRGITQDELFKRGRVLLKDKKNVSFDSYSVQVNPGLPEAITEQIENLLDRGEQGANKIQELLQYYRGNKYVIDAVENLLKRTFRDKGVKLHKDTLLGILFPTKLNQILTTMSDQEDAFAFIDKNYSLFILLDKLGEYQDYVKGNPDIDENEIEFSSFDEYVENERAYLENAYRKLEQSVRRRAYFFNVVYPLVFGCIRANILEYQEKASILEEVS